MQTIRRQAVIVAVTVVTVTVIVAIWLFHTSMILSERGESDLLGRAMGRRQKWSSKADVLNTTCGGACDRFQADEWSVRRRAGEEIGRSGDKQK